VSQVRIKKRGPIIVVERCGSRFRFAGGNHVRAAREYLDTHLLVSDAVVYLDAIHEPDCSYDDSGICTCTPTILERARGIN
jgi:hypothetical protein